jgi:hypothetical protein
VREVTAEELRPLLAELEGRLRDYGAPVAGALRPGAPPERVRTELENDGLRAHEDLVTWWGWHEGAEAGDGDAPADGPGIFFRPETAVAGPWHVLSLADALRIRRWYRGQGLMEMLVPVLQFEGQPVLCAESTGGALFVVDEGVLPDEPPQFASLADFVRTVLRLFDEGLIVPHPELPGVPWFEHAALDGDLRRLSTW